MQPYHGAVASQPEAIVDTGASVSIVSKKMQKRCFPNAVVHHTSVRLRTYKEDTMAVLGEMSKGMVPGGAGYSASISLGIATVRKVPSLPDALLHK